MNNLDARVAVIHAFHSENDIEQKEKKKIKEIVSREEQDHIMEKRDFDLESVGKEKQKPCPK